MIVRSTKQKVINVIVIGSLAFVYGCTSKSAKPSEPGPKQDDKKEEVELQDHRTPIVPTDPQQNGNGTVTAPGSNGGTTITPPTQPGTTQPGTTQPGTTQPGTTQPGTTQPGITPPPSNNPPPPPPGEPRSYKPLEGEVTEARIAEWVEADKARRGDNASKYRYAYIPTEFLADAKEANLARVGLSKALNSVAVNADDIVSPEEASEGYGVVFAIPIEGYWKDSGERKWNIVASGRPKQVFSPAPRLDLRSFDANKAVSADRLVYNLLHGGIYNQLIETPPYGRELIKRLGADKVTTKMGVNNAIVFGPRFSQRRELPNGQGALWETFDDFYGRKGELRWLTANNPVPRFRYDGMVADYGTVASETWHHMKNGMLAYYIWGNANQERTKAEQSFVVDPLNHKGRDLLTGFCVFCHATGVQAAPSDMAKAMADGRITGSRLEKAKEFWSTEAELTEAYIQDKKIYQDAMRKIVYGISSGDSEFNESLVSGIYEKEPAYFTISTITGSNRRGNINLD